MFAFDKLFAVLRNIGRFLVPDIVYGMQEYLIAANGERSHFFHVCLTPLLKIDPT